MLKWSTFEEILRHQFTTEEREVVLAVIFEKISLHSPLDTKNRFGRTFLKKSKFLCPSIYLGKMSTPSMRLQMPSER